MFLVFGTYADGSGHTHKRVEGTSDLIKLLVESNYDYHCVWETSEHYDDPLEIDLVYTNVPGDEE